LNTPEEILAKLEAPKVRRCKSCGAIYRGDNKNRLHLRTSQIHALVAALKHPKGIVRDESYTLSVLGMAKKVKALTPAEEKAEKAKQAQMLKDAVAAIKGGKLDAATDLVNKARSKSYDFKWEVYILTPFGREVAQGFVPKGDQ
jgi:phage terminase large subunit-like protein